MSPNGNGKAKNKKGKNPEIAALLKKDLLVRVRHLHTVARDAAKAYVENLERDFVKAVGTLENHEKTKIKPSALKPVIRLIEQTSLKPEKGRRKDLKRIERILDAIDTAVSEKKK